MSRKSKKPVEMKCERPAELCACGRKTFLDATRASEGETVPHCPRCEMPAKECECPDYKPEERK